MTEPTDPKNGAEQPSQQNPEEHGIFRPAPGADSTTPTSNNNETYSKSTQKVDGIRSGKPINLEKLRLRGRITGKIEIIQQNANEILGNPFGELSPEMKKEVKGVVSELHTFKNDLEASDENLEAIDADVSEIEKEIKAIRLRILETAEEEKHRALLAQNEIEKIKLLYQAQSNYRKIKNESHDDLVRLSASNQNDEVITLFESLSWLEDFNEIEEFAKKDLSEVNKIETALEEFVTKLFDAIVNLDNKEMIAKEREFQEKLIEGAKAHSKTFIELKEETGKLTTLDQDKRTLCEEQESKVTAAEKAFDTSLSNDAYLLFSKELEEYRKLLESMKPLVGTSTASVIPSAPENEDPLTTTTGSREPGDIDIPNISKDERAKDKENSYKVKIDGNFITVPWVLLATLNRYKTTFSDTRNKDIDFSKATALKEVVCNAIEVANFKLADDNARALGAELDSITRRATDPVKNTGPANTSSPTPNSSPQQEEKVPPATAQIPEPKKASGDILLPEISLNPKARSDENKYKIKIDGKWEIVPQEHWETLNNFKAMFDDVEYSEKDFTLAISLKDAVLEALRVGNFAEADKQARALGAKLDTFINEKISAEPKTTEPSAEEYLTDFSGTKRSSPLRPTVSGSEPSSTVKKAILPKTITKEMERLTAIEKILNQSLPYLSSDLEKTAFTKLLQKQKVLEESIKETPTLELTDALKKGNDFLATELDKKKNFIEAQFGDITKSTPTEVNNDTKIVRSARLRGTDDALETLGERSVRLKSEEGSADIAQTRALNNKAELFEIHKKMFEENPTEYRNIYANKNKVRDSLTEDISTHTLANINTPSAQEEVARKAFLKNLVGLSPQEYLKELAVQKHDTMKKKQELVLNNLNGITLENYDVVLGELDAQLALIQGEEKKYTAAILSKFTKTEVAPKPTLRQVYRPSQDDSLGDTTRGLGRNFEVNENNEVVKINKENLTQEQIETDFANEVNPKDSQAIRPLQEKINLADSPHSTHTMGMSPLFNEEEDESPQHAFSNEDIETVRQQTEVEEATKKLQEEQESKERANEKLVQGGKLFDSLVKKIKPTTSRQWFLLALTTLGLSAGAGVAFGKESEKNGPEDKRLIDEYKKQPGWKNYLAEKVSEGFLKDFNGEGKLDYKELIVKYAPSFNINPNNPSAGDKLSSLLCKDVYFVIGANAGINEKQQVESSILIDNLKEIMIAAKASLGTLYSEEAIQSGAIFGDMTIQQYYDVVRKEVENADSERARLQAIKR